MMAEAEFFDILRQGLWVSVGRDFDPHFADRFGCRLNGGPVSSADLDPGNDADFCAESGRDAGRVLGVDDLHDAGVNQFLD